MLQGPSAQRGVSWRRAARQRLGAATLLPNEQGAGVTTQGFVHCVTCPGPQRHPVSLSQVPAPAACPPSITSGCLIFNGLRQPSCRHRSILAKGDETDLPPPPPLPRSAIPKVRGSLRAACCCPLPAATPAPGAGGVCAGQGGMAEPHMWVRTSQGAARAPATQERDRGVSGNGTLAGTRKGNGRGWVQSSTARGKGNIIRCFSH